MKHKIVGYLQVGTRVPFTKMFELDISVLETFSNACLEDVEKTFVKCDLDGYVKNAFNISSPSHDFACLID